MAVIEQELGIQLTLKQQFHHTTRHCHMRPIPMSSPWMKCPIKPQHAHGSGLGSGSAGYTTSSIVQLSL